MFGFDDLLLHGGELIFGDVNVSGGQEGSLDEMEGRIVDHSSQEPHEGLLKLVITFGANVVVLQVLLSVEGDLLGLNLAILDVNLVSDQHNGDAFANARQIFEPLGHVGVGDARAHVEHNDAAVAADVVSIAQTAQFLLTRGVPNVEDNLAVVRVEGHRVHFDAQSGNVLLLELASQVTLHERGLANATVADKDEFELGNLCLILILNHLRQKAKKGSVKSFVRQKVLKTR